MKVSVGLVLVVAFGLLAAFGECRRYSRGFSCLKRADKKVWRGMLPKVQCKEPKLTLVPLQAPDNYEWVFPNVVQVMKCGGHLCQRGWQCVGDSFKNRTFRVKGMEKNRLDETCVRLTVQEDEDCSCRCVTQASDCGPREEYDTSGCRCVCQSALEMHCLEMMRDKPGMYMWNPDTCSCRCNNEGQACSSGTSWVPEHCSCRITRALEEDEY